MKQGHNIIYTVQCKDSFYYTGITNKLEKELDERNDSKDVFSFTYNQMLVTLKYFGHFTGVKQPIARDKQLRSEQEEKRGFV